VTETTELTRPIPLRAYLEAGCDPRAIVDMDWLVDPMQTALDHPPSARARAVAVNRWDIEETLAGRGSETIWTKATHGRGWDSIQQYVTAESWASDILEDPTLVEELVALMTPEERAEWEQRISPEGSGYPMTVGMPERWWNCQGCLTAFEADVAIACTVQNGAGDLPHELHYCFECVTKVYEAMKAAQT
jgi:hypothetical protein